MSIFNLMINILSSDTFDDNALMKDLKNGNKQSFETLYNRYKNQIYSYVRHIVNFDQFQAEEITADTFIQAYTYIQKQDINNFKSFLYKTAHNIAINHIEKEQTQKFIINENLQNLANQEEEKLKENVNRKFKHEILQYLLQDLEQKYKEVIYLYYFEGYDYDKIAEITNSNKNTVGTLLSRAKEQLKKLATTYGYENFFSN